MTMQKRLRGMILAVAMSFAAYAAYAEQITVSTYYPSPFGSYQTLTSGVLDSTGQTHLATGANVGVRIGSTNNATGTNRLEVTGNTLMSGNTVITGTAAVNSGTLTLGTGGTGGVLRVSCDGTNCYAVYA